MGGIALNRVASQFQYDSATSSLTSTFQAEKRKAGKRTRVVSALGMQQLSQKSLVVFCLQQPGQNCGKGQALAERMSGEASGFAGTLLPQAKSGLSFLREKEERILKRQLAISTLQTAAISSHCYCRLLNRVVSEKVMNS